MENPQYKPGLPLDVFRVWKMGSSIVIPLHKFVREALHAEPDDLIVMRLHPPYATLVKVVPEKIIPLHEMGPEILPPIHLGDKTRGRVQSDSEGDADPAAAAAPSDDERSGS